MSSNTVVNAEGDAFHSIFFHGGANHSFQILATIVDKATNLQVLTGQYQWHRLVKGSFVPIQGANTRAYAATADDLYTTVRFEFRPVAGNSVFVDVPSQFFAMDNEVRDLVAKYVEIGRASGISFNIANVGIEPVTEGWSIVVAENSVQLRQNDVVVAIYGNDVEVVLSPRDPTIFRIGTNYLQTSSLRYRDVIVLTVRALLGHL